MLSPENLTCDGELSRSDVTRREKAITKELKSCFKILGKTVSEDESWDWEQNNNKEDILTQSLLSDALKLCKDKNESVEYTIQFMQDYANTDFDTVIEYIIKMSK